MPFCRTRGPSTTGKMERRPKRSKTSSSTCHLNAPKPAGNWKGHSLGTKQDVRGQMERQAYWQNQVRLVLATQHFSSRTARKRNSKKPKPWANKSNKSKHNLKNLDDKDETRGAKLRPFHGLFWCLT